MKIELDDLIESWHPKKYSQLPYRTGANNGRSWIGAALEYKPQFLDQKIFFCIKASLNHKPQKKPT